MRMGIPGVCRARPRGRLALGIAVPGLPAVNMAVRAQDGWNRRSGYAEGHARPAACPAARCARAAWRPRLLRPGSARRAAQPLVLCLGLVSSISRTEITVGALAAAAGAAAAVAAAGALSAPGTAREPAAGQVPVRWPVPPARLAPALV